jgi:hypothetical protein
MVSKSSSFSEHRQTDKADDDPHSRHISSFNSAVSNTRFQEVSLPTLKLPSYFPLLEQSILEIDSLAWDLNGSLDSWLAQSAYWGESEQSLFSRQYSNKESILRQKIRSAEVLAIARLGTDRARVLRQNFQDIDFLVTNFRLKTNSFELNLLLKQVQEYERFILNQFQLLESASIVTHPDNFDSTSIFRGPLGESTSMLPSRPIVLEPLSADSTRSHFTFDSTSIQRSLVHGSPTTLHECSADVAFDSQSRGTASKMIQVSLERSVSGFGVTLIQRGSDVIISAIATGSPSHR